MTNYSFGAAWIILAKKDRLPKLSARRPVRKKSPVGLPDRATKFQPHVNTKEALALIGKVSHL
jgi:hypothetical protein